MGPGYGCDGSVSDDSIDDAVGEALGREFEAWGWRDVFISEAAAVAVVVPSEEGRAAGKADVGEDAVDLSQAGVQKRVVSRPLEFAHDVRIEQVAVGANVVQNWGDCGGCAGRHACSGAAVSQPDPPEGMDVPVAPLAAQTALGFDDSHPAGSESGEIHVETNARVTVEEWEVWVLLQRVSSCCRRGRDYFSTSLSGRSRR